MNTYKEKYEMAYNKLQEVNYIQTSKAPFTYNDCSFQWVECIGDYDKAFGKNVNNVLFYPRFKTAIATNDRNQLLEHEKVYWQHHCRKYYYLMMRQDADNMIYIIKTNSQDKISINHFYATLFEDEIVTTLIENGYQSINGVDWILFKSVAGV